MPYAFVNGGSGEIGSAIALKLHEMGYSVGVSAFKNKAKAEEISQKTEGDYFISDFSNIDDVIKTSRNVIEKHPKIDILVNASGMSKYGLFNDFTSDDTLKIFNVNVLSLMNFTRELLPSMIHRKYGKIINIVSMWGECGASCEVDYSASKGALIAFTKALAKEVAPSGITVNAVSPGAIDTKMMDIFDANEKKDIADNTPIGRLGEPWEIAESVGFLASHSADFITGEILRVNGGFLI